MKTTLVVRTVVKYVLLHTAVITLVAASVGHGDVSLLNFIWVGVLVVYTSKCIVRNIDEGISQRIQEMLRVSGGLQTASANLDLYAKQLEKRVGFLNERQIELEERFALLNRYSQMMKELLCESADLPAKVPESSAPCPKSAQNAPDIGVCASVCSNSTSVI